MSNLVFHRDIFVEDEDFRLKRLPYYVTHEYFGGGKTSTSTQSVSIPPEVLARYNSVNATAQQVAQQPFQQYSSDPNAFVEPLNSTQQQAIANTNAGATAAQPYYSAATNMAVAGSGPTNVGQLTEQDIGQYMNPFVNSVVAPAAQLLNQQQQAQQSGQTGNAIKSGAFGGDRAGIAAANLAGQQSLSFANAINPLYSQAYTSGLGAAQQQQGFNLGQQQANLGRLSQGAQTIAGLGTGAQTAALQGAQSQLAAGQVAQQTEQAGKSALYNQFLQQQGYPFQVAQFLANIAEGTGALSGSTTTTTQPRGLLGNRGGLMRAAGGSVDVENEGQGYYAGGLSHGGYADGDAPGLEIFGMPHQHSVNPSLAAALSAGVGGSRQLMRPTMALPKLPQSGLSEVSSLVSGGNDLASGLGKAGSTAQGVWNKISPSTTTSSPTDEMHANGGLAGYANGGDIDPYHPDDADGYMGPTMKAQNNAPRPQLLQAGAAPQKPDSALKQLQGGVGAAKTLYGAGKGLSSLIIPDAAAGAPAAAAGAAGAADAAGLAGGAGAAASGMPAWLMALVGLPFGVQRGGSVRQGLADGGTPSDDEQYAGMDPDFQRALMLQQADLEDRGIPTKIISGFRDPEKQDQLYAQGRSAPGPVVTNAPGGSSLHNYGRAADLAPLEGSRADMYAALRETTPDNGLTWGGNFKSLYDPGHVQLGTLAEARNNAPPSLVGEPIRLAQADTDVTNDAGLGAGASRNLAPASTGLAGLFEKNKNWLIPLARGLGAAQQSHAIGLAGTLAAGIGGAGKAYAEQEQEQAGLGQTEANTGLARAQTAKTLADTSQSGMNADMVPLANGTYMPKTLWLADYFKGVVHPTRLGNEAALAAAAAGAGVSGTAQHGAPTLPPVPAVAPIGGAGQPAPSASPQKPAQQGQPQQRVGMLGESGHKALDADYQKLLTQKLSNPETYAADMARSKDVGDQAQSAWSASRAQGSTLNQIAPQIIGLSDKGPLQTGPLNKIKLAAISRINDIARTFPGSSQFQILPEEVGTENAISKLSGLMQFATTHNASQNSLSALETASHVVPSTNLDKNGAIKVMAGMYIDKQQAIDFHRYLDEYTAMAAKKYPGMQGNYLAQSAASAFAEDHPTTQYAQEKEALTRLMTANYENAPILPQLIHGDLPFSAVMKSKLLNLPVGLDRYFKDN